MSIFESTEFRKDSTYLTKACHDSLYTELVTCESKGYLRVKNVRGNRTFKSFQAILDGIDWILKQGEATRVSI
jgi:hypothetical protein